MRRTFSDDAIITKRSPCARVARRTNTIHRCMCTRRLLRSEQQDDPLPPKHSSYFEHLKMSAADVVIMEETVPVQLHVYDMTQGMARRWSPMLLGQQVDGIWHSGIVIRGLEYFFGYGILKMPAGKTMFGTPTQVLQLGNTSLSAEQFQQLLAEQEKGLFGNTDYGLIYHNCNHFSNHMSKLLTGKGIPEDIFEQAEILIDTRIGRFLTPLLSRMDGRLSGSVVTVKFDKLKSTSTAVPGAWLTGAAVQVAFEDSVKAAAAAVANGPAACITSAAGVVQTAAAAAVLVAAAAEKGPMSLIVTASASTESLPDVLLPLCTELAT